MRRGLRPSPVNVEESNGALLGAEIFVLLCFSSGFSTFGLNENKDEIICVGREGPGAGRCGDSEGTDETGKSPCTSVRAFFRGLWLAAGNAAATTGSSDAVFLFSDFLTFSLSRDNWHLGY